MYSKIVKRSNSVPGGIDSVFSRVGGFAQTLLLACLSLQPLTSAGTSPRRLSNALCAATSLATIMSLGASVVIAAPVVIESLTVTGIPARMELLYQGGSQWQPTLEQTTENAHQTTIRLSLSQATVPKGFLESKSQWLNSLQESYPGLYYLQADTARDGVVSLVFKSTSPYRASLCAVAHGQVGVCFQSQASSSAGASSPASLKKTVAANTAQVNKLPPATDSVMANTPVSPDDPLLEQARSAFLQFRLADARQLLERYFATHLEPSADAQFLYAQTLIGLGQPQSAIAPLSLIELQHPQAGLLKASLQLRQGQLDTAGLTLDSVRQQFGVSAPFLYEMGLLSQSRQRLTEAIGYYRAALAERPDWSDAWFHLAQVLVVQKNWPGALVSLNELLLLRPDDIQALKLKAFVYQSQQRPKDALAVYRTAVNPDLLYNYAVLAKQQKQYATAKTMALAAHSLADDNPVLLFNLGLLLADIDEKPTARHSLYRYITLAGNQASEAARVARAKSMLTQLKD